MTVQVSDHDLIASFAHALEDRARSAREWERQSNQWEARWRAVTAERDEARAAAARTEEQVCIQLQQQILDVVANGMPDDMRAAAFAVWPESQRAALEQMLNEMEPGVVALEAERDTLARQLAELTQLIGAETPIAAFTLAETWRAEKAHMMDAIQHYGLALSRISSGEAGAQAIASVALGTHH